MSLAGKRDFESLSHFLETGEIKLDKEDVKAADDDEAKKEKQKKKETKTQPKKKEEEKEKPEHTEL